MGKIRNNQFFPVRRDNPVFNQNFHFFASKIGGQIFFSKRIKFGRAEVNIAANKFFHRLRGLTCISALIIPMPGINLSLGDDKKAKILARNKIIMNSPVP